MTTRLTFVEEADVETQVFDWGKLAWLSSPRATGAEKFSSGIVTVNPNKGHSRHNHPGCEEIIYMLSGRGKMMVEIGGKPVEKDVAPGTMIHVPPGVFHASVNTAPEPWRMLVVYCPHGPEEEMRRDPAVKIEPPKRKAKHGHTSK